MAYEKYPGPGQLDRELTEGRLRPMYLLLGEEEGEKDKLIIRIRDMLFRDSPMAQSGRFHCENDELMSAAEFALMPSMFSPVKLCILCNVDAVKQKPGKTDGKSSGKKSLLQDIITGLPEGTTLIATSTKNSVPDTIPKELSVRFSVYQFWRYFERDLIKYINLNLKKSGLSTEERVPELILEKTGRDIQKIDEAIDLLISSCSGKIITRKNIADFVPDNGEVSVYEFTDLLFRRAAGTLSCYKKLTDSGIPTARIFSEIVRQTSLLEMFHSIKKETSSPAEAMDRCGIFKKNRDSFLAMTEIFDSSKTGFLYRKIMKADWKRKSGNQGKTMMSDPVFDLVCGILYGEEESQG